MNSKLFCLILLLGSILFSCIMFDKKELPKEVGIEGTENLTVEKVDLQELISNPKNWEDSLVETEGYYRSGFEESALYIGRTGDGLTNKGMWLNFSKDLLAKLAPDSEYYNKKIRVRGRVSLKKGHAMQYPATIEDVYYIALVEE